MRTLTAILPVLLFAAGSASAKTLRVPSKFATIPDAVAAAGPGDVILLAPGEYVGPFLISQKEHLTLRGADERRVTLVRAEAFMQSSILGLTQCAHVKVSHVTFSKLAGSALFLDRCDGVTVSDCRVEGDALANPGGIRVVSGSDLRFENLQFRGITAEAALLIGGIADAQQVHGKVRVTDCRFTDVHGAGILANCESLEVERNRFQRVDLVAVRVDAVTTPGQLHVAHNSIAHGTEFAIRVESGHDTIIENNRLRDLDGYAIVVQSSGSLRVRDNEIADAGGGISVEVAGARVDRNRIQDVVEDGISLSGEGSRATHNAITRCEFGILSAAPLSVLVANRTSDPLDGGIVIESTGEASVLERNHVARSKAYGIYVEAPECDLIGNAVRKSATIGFQIVSNANVLQENSAHGSATFDLQCDLQSNSVAKSNHFGTVNDLP